MSKATKRSLAHFGLLQLAHSFSVNYRSRTFLAVTISALGFAISWYLLHHGWYALDHLFDTREYNRDARLILNKGQTPYLNFKLEYPPLSIPLFLLPRLLGASTFPQYQQIFQLMMCGCGMVSVGLAAYVISLSNVSTRRVVFGVALLAAMPLMLGAVMLSRYDLFPTMLTIGALTAIYTDRNRTGFALLALGTAAKAYPAVIVPIAFVYVWRTLSRREALACLSVFAAIVLVCFLPFAIIAPKGLWWSIHGQETRPPQIESLVSAIFLAAHQLVGTHLTTYFTHQSDNIDGHPAMRAAGYVSIVQIVALVVIWASYARGAATKQRLLLAATAAVCAFIVFDRVLSPQYLIWLAPLVATLTGRRGVVAVVMLAVAMGLTQIWYPTHFEQLKLFQPLESWAVVARDTLLVALCVTTAWPDATVRRSLPWLGRGRGRRRVPAVEAG
jgi:hypothetical protein